ncbi:hypothetical protein BDD12DRAFT_808008 [Trichophaea hybrida]|nr:hypothetical protein BDD12DRAFT_808008 [Trichophaea hybrida]
MDSLDLKAETLDTPKISKRRRSASINPRPTKLKGRVPVCFPSVSGAVRRSNCASVSVAPDGRDGVKAVRPVVTQDGQNIGRHPPSSGGYCISLHVTSWVQQGLIFGATESDMDPWISVDDHRGRLFSVPGRPFRPSPSCLKKPAPFPPYPRTDGMTSSRPVLSSSRTDGTVEFTETTFERIIPETGFNVAQVERFITKRFRLQSLPVFTSLKLTWKSQFCDMEAVIETNDDEADVADAIIWMYKGLADSHHLGLRWRLR